MKKAFLVLSALLICVCSFGAEAKVIRIRNQEEFDLLNISIHNAVTRGASNVVVKFSPGKYFFSERHVSLGDIDNPGLSLKLIGRNALIISNGRMVSTEKTIEDFNYNSSVVNVDSKELINMWSDLQYADSDVEILDTTHKTCRLKSNGIASRTPEECKGSFIMITAWCRTYYYQITRIEDSYIYFIADNLQKSRVNKNGFNVKDDYYKTKDLPRFRISNLEPVYKGNLHVCEAQTFAFIVGGRFKSISIEGFTFLGNSTKGDLEGSPSSLLVFNNVSAEGIRISKCKFLGHNSRVISISKTHNVQIDSNFFAHNFRNGITSYNSCRGTIVKDNKFEYNGESLSYERCVSCSGEDYYIANNSFTNYGYCAISVGLYYGATPENEPRGIIEKNMLLYTKEWMENLWRHSIMDSGAIYLWTQNNVAIVRNNCIINYGGVYFNNGIYCDDGARGAEIYGNIILGIENGYSIHSRRVKSVDSQVGEANVNNKIYDNIFDGGFHFVGHEGDNECRKGRNFIVYHPGEKKPEITVKNIRNAAADDYVEVIDTNNSKIIVDRSHFKRLGRSKVGSVIRKYFWWKQ